jgi:membrane protease YdiL (CAAX protease family)
VLAGFGFGSGSVSTALTVTALLLVVGVGLHVEGIALSIALAPACLTLAGAAQLVFDISWRLILPLLLAALALPSKRDRSCLLTISKRLVAPPQLTPGLIGVIGLVAVSGSAVLTVAFEKDQSWLVFGPRWSWPALAAAALFNGVVEELLWRGVLAFELQQLGAPTVSSAVATSLSFGLAHLNGGYPTGPVGVGLTAVFGFINTALVLRTRSIMVPAALHAGFDALILSRIYG